MERFLGYHLYGKGITGSGIAMPLATGSHTHSAIEYILKNSWNEIPNEELVREAIQLSVNAYEQEIASQGWLDPEVGEERVLYVLQEQTTLIHGLVWAWASYILPLFLEEYEVKYVEQEMERIYGCTCGLANIGDVANHKERNCTGLVVMTRPDIVAVKYTTGAWTYHEVKTGGKIDSDTFEGDVQFAFGALGVEGYTGEELTESYVHALNKGYRVARDGGPKLQQSAFCYGYYKEGIDGLVPPEIRTKWGGKGIKSFTKTPVWEMQLPNAQEGISPVEQYIAMMKDEELESNVYMWGPFPYPKQQAEEMLQDAYHLETHLDNCYSYINEKIEEDGLGSEEVQMDLHEFVPKSWQCRRFGHQICQFYRICNKYPGWETPCASMDFKERTPNHPIEFEV
jgi:hypothetical protein